MHSLLEFSYTRNSIQKLQMLIITSLYSAAFNSNALVISELNENYGLTKFTILYRLLYP